MNDENARAAPAGDLDNWVRHAFDLTRVGAADDARQWMERAAASGHTQAPIFAAIWRLVGYAGPVDPDAAQSLLERAVRNGEPLGHTLLAALAVSDLQGPRDWELALSRLIRAAQIGEPRAMLQLALLLPAGDPDRSLLIHAAATRGEGTASYFHGRALFASAHDGERAEGLRWLAEMAARGEPCSALLLAGRQVSPAVGAAREVPRSVALDWDTIGGRILWPHERPIPPSLVQVEAPRIAQVAGLLTRDECHYLMSRGAPYLQPAQVADDGGHATVSRIRSNDSMLFSPADTDVVVQSIDSRIAAVLARPASHGERLALLRYAPGQAYAPHCDWIDPLAPGKAQLVTRQGQRVSTLLVYLNSEYEAGATRFVRLNWSFRGEPGDALLWSNVTSNGSVDPRTLHAGEPPTAGQKWLLSKWMRDRPQSPVRS